VGQFEDLDWNRRVVEMFLKSNNMKDSIGGIGNDLLYYFPSRLSLQLDETPESAEI
jgi:hypothetical protein